VVMEVQLRTPFDPPGDVLELSAPPRREPRELHAS